MSKLIMLMGCPGAGKSTYAKTLMAADEIYVSRDNIRFSLVKKDEEYFSKEKEVFQVYVAEIECALRKGYTVWADATHLNRASRLKLLRALSIKPDIIDVVWVKTPLEIALERNEGRKGTRAYVPESAIRRMYDSIQKPEFCEGEFEYNTIYIKEPSISIQIYQRETNE